MHRTIIHLIHFHTCTQFCFQAALFRCLSRKKISIQSNRIHISNSLSFVCNICVFFFVVCPFVIIISNTCYDWLKRSTAARQLVSFVFPLMMIEGTLNSFPFFSSLFCPFISHDLSFCKLQCLYLVHRKHNLYPKSMAKPFFFVVLRK